MGRGHRHQHRDRLDARDPQRRQPLRPRVTPRKSKHSITPNESLPRPHPKHGPGGGQTGRASPAPSETCPGGGQRWPRVSASIRNMALGRAMLAARSAPSETWSWAATLAPSPPPSETWPRGQYWPRVSASPENGSGGGARGPSGISGAKPAPEIPDISTFGGVGGTRCRGGHDIIVADCPFRGNSAANTLRKFHDHGPIMVRAATPPGQSGRNGPPSARQASGSGQSASANTEISGAEHPALARRRERPVKFDGGRGRIAI